jgi:K+-sensing histidine kinase KdpD
MVNILGIDETAIADAQSLKPYARSLSHELRTPMHGVTGMLDVMHATLQEAIESQQNAKLRNILQALKENIELVQGMTTAFTFFPSAGLMRRQIVLVEQSRLRTILFSPTS